MFRTPHVAILTGLLFMVAGLGCSNSNDVAPAGGGNNSGENVFLTDADGNPLSHVYWSVSDGSAFDALSGGAAAFTAFEDGNGGTCNDPSAETPNTDDGTAAVEGCTGADGGLQFVCTGNYTLYVDVGDGTYYSQELTCSGGSTETPTEIQFPDVDGPTHLVLYVGIDGTTGNIGTRAQTDAICAAAAPEGARMGNAHAFLSYSATDQLVGLSTAYGLPTNIPIASVLGIPVADDWSDFFDGTIDMSYIDAGITDNAIWSGSLGNGTADATCNGWSDASDAAFANQGDEEATAEGGYLNNTTAACYQTRIMLCIAPSTAALSIK